MATLLQGNIDCVMSSCVALICGALSIGFELAGVGLLCDCYGVVVDNTTFIKS